MNGIVDVQEEESVGRDSLTLRIVIRVAVATLVDGLCKTSRK